jgi:DNA polymerase-3 subunit delta'
LSSLLGQPKAWNKLVSFSKHLPQSTLLVGPNGVGKRLAALSLFQLINCVENPEREPCENCVICKKITAKNHPDWIEIIPQSNSIGIDEIRELRKTLNFSPIESKKRFIVIRESEKLTIPASNTLLKMIEEPPAHTHFFFTVQEKNQLLQTIQSRSQFVYFSPLDPPILNEILEKKGFKIPSGLEEWVFDLLEGGVDHSEWFSEENAFVFLKDTLKYFEKLSQITNKTDRVWDEIVLFSESLVQEEWKLSLYLNLALIWSRKMALKNSIASKEWSHFALQISHLFTRHSLHANKKIIALVGSTLPTGMGLSV